MSYPMPGGEGGGETFFKEALHCIKAKGMPKQHDYYKYIKYQIVSLTHKNVPEIRAARNRQLYK